MDVTAVRSTHLITHRCALFLECNGRHLYQLLLLFHELRLKAQDFVVFIRVDMLKVTRICAIRFAISFHGGGTSTRLHSARH